MTGFAFHEHAGSLYPANIIGPAVEAARPTKAEELARRAGEEHALALGAMRDALLHAVRAGRALIELREGAPPGGWEALAVERGISPSRARDYIRLAHYDDLVLRLPDGTTISEALRTHLRGLPPAAPRDGRGGEPYPEETRERARRMRAEGASYRQVGQALGVDRKTAQAWADGRDPRDKGRRQSKARESYVAARRERGSPGSGALQEAHALVVRAAGAVERARAEVGGEPEARGALSDAKGKLELARDDLEAAAKIADQRRAAGSLCPGCGAFLPRRRGRPPKVTVCPSCGERA